MWLIPHIPRHFIKQLYHKLNQNFRKPILQHVIVLNFLKTQLLLRYFFFPSPCQQQMEMVSENTNFFQLHSSQVSSILTCFPSASFKQWKIVQWDLKGTPTAQTEAF